MLQVWRRGAQTVSCYVPQYSSADKLLRHHSMLTCFCAAPKRVHVHAWRLRTASYTSHIHTSVAKRLLQRSLQSQKGTSLANAACLNCMKLHMHTLQHSTLSWGTLGFA